jgi:hypothetical protein
MVKIYCLASGEIKTAGQNINEYIQRTFPLNGFDFDFHIPVDK